MSDFDDASLVMIPSGYKTSKVYSVKPTDGTGDLTFSRSNDTATRVNSAGLIEKVRTNLALQSQAFNTTANWPTNASPTVTANTTVAPDGTTTADTIAATASFSGVYQSFGSISNGVEYSWSVYIKNISSASNIFLGVVTNPSTATLNFNATSGTIIGTGGSITSSSVTSVGNGWYRLSGTYISTGTSTDFAIYGMGTMSFAVWGAQLETGVTTDYIATTTAAVSVGPVANVPRLDYLNSSCPRLLLEPQRTNAAQYSEQLDNAWWTKNNQSVTANNTTAPDGFSSADLLIPAAGTADHYILSSTVSSTASQAVTVSLFIKKKDHDYFYFGTGGASAFGAVVYRFSTNTFTVSGLGATATNYGNGWIRLTITGTTGATDLRMLFTPTDATGLRTFNANGTDGTWVWGCQAETAVSYATSYIPTLGAAVTRGADACSKTGISSLIGQTEGVIFYDGVLTGISNPYANLINSEKNTTGAFSIGQRSTGAILCGFFVGGSSVITFDAGSYAVGTRTKIAFAYKSGSSVLYVNGSQLATSTATFTPIENIDDIFIGDETTYFNYKENTQVNQVALFQTRLTNAELASLTTL